MFDRNRIQILCDHVDHTRFHIVEMECQMVQLLSAHNVGPTMLVNLAKQRQLKVERVPTILIRALSWALSVFGNTFTLEKSLRVWTIGTASNLCNSG